MHRPEINRIAADLQMTRSISSMQNELSRGVPQLCFDKITAHSHNAGLVIDDGAAASIHFASGVASDLKTELFEYPVGGIEYPLNLFGR
jgi:hypothetical protein